MPQIFNLYIQGLARHLTLRYIQLALICFVCARTSYGQTGTRSYHTLIVENTKKKKPKRVYTKVEIQPTFPGLDSSWIQSLEDSLNRSLSVLKKVKAGTYIVSVRFLIEKDSNIADIACIRDPGSRMCEQVKAELRKKFKFKWRPQWKSPGKENNHTLLKRTKTNNFITNRGCVQQLSNTC